MKAGIFVMFLSTTCPVTFVSSLSSTWYSSRLLQRLPIPWSLPDYSSHDDPSVWVYSQLCIGLYYSLIQSLVFFPIFLTDKVLGVEMKCFTWYLSTMKAYFLFMQMLIYAGRRELVWSFGKLSSGFRLPPSCDTFSTGTLQDHWGSKERVSRWLPALSCLEVTHNITSYFNFKVVEKYTCHTQEGEEIVCGWLQERLRQG